LLRRFSARAHPPADRSPRARAAPKAHMAFTFRGCAPTAGAPAAGRSRAPLRVRAVAEPTSARASAAAAAAAPAKVARSESAMSAAPAASPAASIKQALVYTLGKRDGYTPRDLYEGTAWAVRQQLMDSFDKTHAHWKKEDPKFVYYLSAEFLMGRSLSNVVNNLQLKGPYADALRGMGAQMETIVEQERDAALGNGGLGRLAACFLDSIASLDLPGWGYGIRYKYGMFKQLVDKAGYQQEAPDIWLTSGNPWEIPRRDISFDVCFGGKTTVSGGKTTWVPSEKVKAVAFDNPIPGYATTTTSNLRLWDAQAHTEFDLAAFNSGDYDKAVLDRDRAEAISAVLYPNDSTPEGKELRLKQQFFFVSASLQDVMSRFKAAHGPDWDNLPTKACFQMNDTHPTIAVAEMMRLLVDVEGLDWERAWGITQRVVNYTNHTVMPEALEKWPVKVLAKMLPRHMEIIDIINTGWLAYLDKALAKLPADQRAAKAAAMSIIHENQWAKEEMLVNMAFLAVVAASAVNGVAAIHSEIVKETLFSDFYALFPEKFQASQRRGVTPLVLFWNFSGKRA